MTSFAESCRKLRKNWKEVGPKSACFCSSGEQCDFCKQREYFEIIAEERHSRALDEVAVLKRLSQIRNVIKSYAYNNILNRIADLEAGIKILEGKK